MKMRKTLLCGSLAVVLGSAGMATQAAMLMNGDRLMMDAGVVVYDSYQYQSDVSSGSYFVCDCNGDLKITGTEKIAMSPGSDGGIVIGTTQSPGEIDDFFSFFGIAGRHFTTVAVTGGTTQGLDLSGWNMDWNSSTIPLGTGAWTPVNCESSGVACAGYADGVAVFDWSGVYGDAYTLDYASHVPQGHSSGFGGVPFFLHLEGTVMSAVPLPAAAWLLGSGLLGLLGTARRRLRTER